MIILLEITCNLVINQLTLEINEIELKNVKYANKIENVNRLIKNLKHYNILRRYND